MATWIDWNIESYPEVQDLALLPVFALGFLLLRYLLDRSVFQALGQKLILSRDAATLRKFKESAWKFTYFLSATLFALFVTCGEPWFTDTEQFWVGPGDQIWPDQKMKQKLKLLYIFSGGFYVYSILALMVWETRRKDFEVSMTHHVVTFLLIAGSYPARLARAGSMILALHDVSDVFLECGKMSKYAKSELLPNVFLTMFVISWFLLRLVCFPRIIFSTLVEVVQHFDIRRHKNGPWYYYAFNTFLITLLSLHLYWTMCIYRVVKKQREGDGSVKDVRSDSEDED